MKTKNIIIAALIALAILGQSCEDNFSVIHGEGSIRTETLSIPEFTGIRLTGVENVHISYGPTQKVEVTGHPNIIARIQQDVVVQDIESRLLEFDTVASVAILLEDIVCLLTQIAAIDLNRFGILRWRRIRRGNTGCGEWGALQNPILLFSLLVLLFLPWVLVLLVTF